MWKHKPRMGRRWVFLAFGPCPGLSRSRADLAAARKCTEVTWLSTGLLSCAAFPMGPAAAVKYVATLRASAGGGG